MKKSIVAVVVLLLLIAALPMIGNSFIKHSIDARVAELKSYGLDTQKQSEISSYLHTSRHFEFVLKDSKEFVAYLNKYSDKQISPYVNAMLEGVLIGADVRYSNLPFAKAFEVEIYPIALSQNMQNSLQKNDSAFEKYVDTFLQKKGILYHIEYNLRNSDFKGFLKDIDEEHTLKNGVEVSLILEKAKFNGNGTLLAPTTLEAKIKTFRMEALEKSAKVSISLDGLSSSANFESQNTYLSSAKIKDIKVVIGGTGQDLNASMKNFRINASSNDQDGGVELNSKSSFDSFDIASDILNVQMKKFNFDIAVNGLNKDIFEKIHLLSSQSSMMSEARYQQKLQNLLLNLLSDGLEINIAELSLKNLVTNTNNELQGFKMKIDSKIKKDALLKSKIQTSPFLALGDIDISSHVKISKKLFHVMLQEYGLLNYIAQYAKEDGDDLLFEMKFSDTHASINGKKFN